MQIKITDKLADSFFVVVVPIYIKFLMKKKTFIQ